MSSQEWAVGVGTAFATILVLCIAAVLVASTYVAIRKMLREKDDDA
ncbi:membrane protein [Gordonia phage DalanDe]|nr:membrane protein [Gordonia phage DalanDe]